MEFNATSEKENALFKRKEIEGSIESKITPSREDVLGILAKKFSVDSGVIKIKGIHGKFGSRIFTVSANIYESVEDKDSVEPKKKKDQPKQVEKPTEIAEVAPVETPTVEEKPAEEKLAEKKEEGVNDSNKTPESTDQKDSESKSNNKSEQSGEANKE